MCPQVEQDSFNVLGSFALIVGLLEATGFIMEGTDYETAVDNFPTAGSVLQDFLGLVQIHHCIAKFLLTHFLDCLFDQADDCGGELPCITHCLLSLYTSSWSFAMDNSTVFFKLF